MVDADEMSEAVRMVSVATPCVVCFHPDAEEG
jgi:hypothetical protein